MGVQFEKLKNIAEGGRFEWCPRCVTRCRKIYAPITRTGYIFVGFHGKWKVCSCDGTREGFRERGGVVAEYRDKFCKDCRVEECPYRK